MASGLGRGELLLMSEPMASMTSSCSSSESAVRVTAWTYFSISGGVVGDLGGGWGKVRAGKKEVGGGW